MKRLLIAGTHSGCGKTTVACAILSALKGRGLIATAFKCGPDYIDPIFHRSVSALSAYNLDPFFLDGAGLRSHLACRAGELAVIEGAMGYYDGIGASTDASAYTVARETNTPTILVVSAARAGKSLAASIEGFARYRRPSHISGVIFNQASPARYPDLKAFAAEAGLVAYGTMPSRNEWALPDCHPSLLKSDEMAALTATLSALGRQAARSLDLDGLLALAGTASPLPAVRGLGHKQKKQVRLALARDQAFCFSYKENLELLEALGCELLFFSPLRDRAIPRQIHGLYLGGGYPERYVRALSKNKTMRESIRQAVEGGLPTIAEGGGFVYLHNSLDGMPMCGLIRGAAVTRKRLQRFGYISLTARRDNLLCGAGESIRSHEFHYWASDSPGDHFVAKKAGPDLSYPCIHTRANLYAGFPYLYFPSNPAFAASFVRRMVLYRG
jgi:cobyrinic acid a,c-diamide synthase